MTAIDSDIAADFLVEANEIVERLGEELVALEHSAEDTELLNAIFRGFHTIKGGAGFLNLVPMVEVCHTLEERFNEVRIGARKLDAGLFDAAQGAVDALGTMLQSMAAGLPPEPVSEALKQRLIAANDEHAETSEANSASLSSSTAASNTISDDEFEALLDQLQGNPAVASNPLPLATPSLADLSEPKTPAPVPKKIASPATPGSRSAAVVETTVRVDTKRLDAIVNLTGELVLARNRLKTLLALQRSEPQDRAVATLDQVTTRLQNAVMRTRMQPVGRVLSRFTKMARDVARSVHKEVELELLGAETELDRTLVDALADPLIHLLRNAIDHGIESPSERVRTGKPRVGNVRLSAQQQGDHIAIEVSDDGVGMDPERLRTKAREKGLVDSDTAARMSPEECLQLIFLPGFSTKSEVSEISGRGVGMDVVQARVKELSGRISIHSERGKGSKFLIRVPLTLAILPALLVASGQRPYALPLASVLEVFNFRPESLRWIDGRTVLDLRQDTLPLVFLHKWLGENCAPGGGACVVVLQAGNGRLALLVDQVRGREEVVIKPLPRHLRGVPGYAGATLTGDGNLALILDIDGLAAS